MRRSEYVLFENVPAKNFNEAYPIGNGHLGGMVYGDFPKMRLGLNHDELWSGNKLDDFSEWNKEDFLKYRALALQGKYFEATEEIERHMAIRDAGCYLTLGDMFLDFKNGNVSDYRRSHDIREAVAEVSFFLDGKRINVSYIASFPDKAIFARIESENKISFSVSADMPFITEEVCEDGRLIAYGECPIECERQKRNGSLPKSLEEKRGINFVAMIGAVSDGEIFSEGKALALKDVTHATVVFTATTSYKDGYAHANKDFVHEAAEILDKTLCKEYSDVLCAHKSDVTRHFDKTNISLGQKDTSEIPTSKRIKEFSKDETDIDCDLITLAFHYGKYLFIASGREGTTPPNLQGIWNDTIDPPWCSNYTTNINIQMNYWGAVYCGLFDLFEPLERLMAILTESGKKCANTVYGAKGAVVHHNADIFGNCYPICKKARYSYFPVAGAWILGELYRRYEYSLDEEYLGRIYPFLMENARFIMEMLVDDGEYLIFSPATSPENEFLLNGDICAVALSSTMFGALVRESLGNFVNASKILGYEDELVMRTASALPRLLPTRATDDGRIEEWYFGKEAPDFAEKDVMHRHISHLYDLYPARNVISDSDVLAQAAKKSLDAREDVSTGWSTVWKICCRARLGDGDDVMQLIKSFFTYIDSDVWSDKSTNPGGIYINMFGAYPFQIDANLGFVAAIAEMLVGERNGEPYPLPALPKEIKNGHVRGLCVRGNRKVDMDFEDGRVTAFKVY